MARASAPSSIASAFWEAVLGCLVTFHAYSPGDARMALDRMQSRVNKAPDPDLILHDEPFYVAADIAKSKIRLEGEFAKTYSRILRDAGMPLGRA